MAAKSNGYSHILKYTGLFGGVQGLNILIGIVRNKLVALLLGPEGMGLVSLFNSTIKLVSDSTGLGISLSAVREISESFEKGDETKTAHIVKLIRSWSLLTALVGMLICMLLSPLLNRWTFAHDNYTLHFIMLAPVIFMMGITAGELAILKGTRQLGHLAIISIYGVIGALVTSVPLYYFWKQSAIVPSIIIIALIQMLSTIIYSYRLFPLRTSINRHIMEEGIGMVKLGIAFALAGIIGSGAEFIIRTYLNNTGSLTDVGLYNAGYMMTMTYAGMVFQAMDTDYFPRISGIQNIGRQLNDVVNRQIEVSILIVSPMLVFFIVALPVLLPLLYSGKFLPVMGMMKITVIAMYFRAITLPIEYISLARGDSKSFLLLESVYGILIVIFVIIGYMYSGLTGTGMAITAFYLINVIIVILYTRYRFKYKPSARVIKYCAMQIPLGIAAYISTLATDGLCYWLSGLSLTALSLYISIKIINGKIHLKKFFTDKFRKLKNQ